MSVIVYACVVNAALSTFNTFADPAYAGRRLAVCVPRALSGASDVLYGCVLLTVALCLAPGLATLKLHRHLAGD